MIAIRVRRVVESIVDQPKRERLCASVTVTGPHTIGKLVPMSLAVRAALAVTLMVGFYVLAVGLTAGVLYVPYAEYVYLHRLDGRLAIACIGAALAILVGILPRIDKFEAPG